MATPSRLDPPSPGRTASVRRGFLARLLTVLAVIGVIDTAVLAWSWLDRDRMRQYKVIYTINTLGLSLIVLLLWLLFLSRLRWRVRFAALGGIAAAAVLAASLLEVQGVSGDLVPIVRWRRSAPPAVKAPPIVQGPPTDQAPQAEPTAPPLLRDYPQFLGPQRNAVVTAIHLARDWSATPPRLLWRQPVGVGWSAFAVAGRRALTQEQRGPKECVVCYDVITGSTLWVHDDPVRFESSFGGVGPRATPTIVGNRVYTLGATGVLNCLDLKSGKAHWSRNIIDDSGAVVNQWGMSGSPLVTDGKVIINAGGTGDTSLLAYDSGDGKRLWAAGTEFASYASPLVTNLAGTRQIIMLNHTSITAHDPSNGRILWTYPWPGAQPKVPQPVPLPGDRVFASSGYGVGCSLFQVSRDDAGQFITQLLWKNLNLKAKFTNVVHRDGFIYGLDDGVLVCLDVATGQRRWKDGRYGHGQLILTGDLLVIQAESGEVVLVEATPHDLHELTRFTALDDKTWNCPALAGPYLLVRNDREAACYQLPLAN